MSLLLITTAFTSCTNESENITSKDKQLQLNVAINRPESRAVLTGNNLIDGSSIGVSVVDATGTAYQSQDYNNVCYTGNTVDGTQEWTPERTVTLSGEPATLYAYYPWTEGVDVEAVPVDMTTADQNDWMYATPVTGLSDANAGATVSLHHALANIRLTLYKENYSGAGVVSAYSFQSDAFATGGTLNAKTGTFDALTGEGAALTRTVDYTLTDKASATAFDCMVVPTGASDDIDVSVTVDGHTYTSTVSALTLAKSNAYNLTLKLSSTGLSVTSVSLVDWNEVDLGEEDFTPVVDATDYSDWVKLTYYVDDAAQPVDLVCTLENEGLKAFDIANVTNMAVLENSAARATTEPVEITPTYQYTFSTTGEHTVYVKFADMSKVPDFAFALCLTLVDFVLPEKMTGIGIMSFAYCAGLTGTLNIPISVKTIETAAFGGCSYNKAYINIERIPKSIFIESQITEIIIGPNVKYIEGEEDFQGAFSGMPHLYKIVTEALVAPTIEDMAFLSPEEDVNTAAGGILIVPEGAMGYDQWLGTYSDMSGNLNYLGWKIIEENFIVENDLYYSPDYSILYGTAPTFTGTLNIKEGVNKIAPNAFAYCSGVSSVHMPTTLENIGHGAFYKCSGLTEIVVPNSVTDIGDFAFANTQNLEEITLGSGLKSLGDNVFYMFYRLGYNKLSRIISLAMNAPEITEYTFSGINENGALTIPTSSTGYDAWMSTSTPYLGYYNWTLEYSDELVTE